MKPTTTSNKRIDPAALTAALAVAPDAPVFDADNPPTQPGDWKDAIVSHSLQELREQIAQRRVRGPGKKPARAMTTLRLPAETLARWRASGPGWQTRAAQVLTMHAP
jgi:uncharacterized protein (DUF4415 family)